jgi:hypothetical protein
MKKLNHRYIIVSSVLLCLCHIVTFAQDTQQPADTSTAKLAARLSISQERAGQIQAAYNYQHEGLIQLMNNKTVKPPARQRQFQYMLADRQKKIDVAITLAEKAQLIIADSALIARMQAQAAEIRQRHEQQLNRMPHRVSDSISSTSVNQR